MNEQQINKASFVHKVIIADVLIFHLPMPILAFGIDFMREVILLSSLISLALFIAIASETKNTAQDEFISSHWKLALDRSRYLLIGYVLSVSVLALGWVMITAQADPQLKAILQTAFVHIATVPILFPALFVLVLQTLAISKAKKGIMATNSNLK